MCTEKLEDIVGVSGEQIQILEMQADKIYMSTAYELPVALERGDRSMSDHHWDRICKGTSRIRETGKRRRERSLVSAVTDANAWLSVKFDLFERI